MRQLLHLFASCVIVLTFWSATVAHAADAAGPATMDAGIHFEGDRDEVPADQHKSTPHHHAACDAHQMGIPAALASASPVPVEADPIRAAPVRGLSSAEPDATLRPPIA